MDPIVITSLRVSLIAILVIFTVLVVLIYTIKLLVRLIPYEAPPITARAKSKTSENIVTPDIISAITAAMATHLRKPPQEFYITQIHPK
jgi:Na+-transporting methylmalonyl-CoA/oxaloacetate decarboxylase gamma subunit